MKPLLLLFLFSTPAIADDLNSCRVWLEKLNDIAMYENMIIQDSEKIRREEGPYAAMDFVSDLRSRIRNIQRSLESSK